MKLRDDIKNFINTPARRSAIAVVQDTGELPIKNQIAGDNPSLLRYDVLVKIKDMVSNTPFAVSDVSELVEE